MHIYTFVHCTFQIPTLITVGLDTFILQTQLLAGAPHSYGGSRIGGKVALHEF